MTMTDTPPRPRPTPTSRRARSGDTFPHDLAAEADLLAAAMQSADALTVLASVPVDAFYSPAHKAVAEAVLFAGEHGWRPDRTLVVDELDRMGLLDDIGGPKVVVDLYARTPSTASAGRYADVVLRHWRARQWAALGLEVVERARTGDTLGIVTDLVPRVDDLVVGTKDTGPTYADVAGLLDGRLEEEPPSILHRDDGQALFYRGALNYLHGEPGKGKSWVALAAVAALLDVGLPVVIIDFEDTARNVVGRLRTLGVGEHAIREHLWYIEDPHARPLRELVRLALDPDPELVLIDGVAASITAADLEEDKNSDVNRWIDSLPRPIAAYGSAVIGVDHVTKSKETRGLWPRGAGAKRARIDGAAYYAEVVEPFTRTRSGKLRLRVAKDRRGYIGGENDVAATVKVDPHDAGARLDVRFYKPAAIDSLDGAELTGARPGVNLAVAEILVAVMDEHFREGPFNRDELVERVRARGRPTSKSTVGATLHWLKDHGKAVLLRDGRAQRWSLPPKQGGLRLISEDHDDPTQE